MWSSFQKQFIVSLQCLLTFEKQNIAQLLNADYNGWTQPQAKLKRIVKTNKRVHPEWRLNYN